MVACSGTMNRETSSINGAQLAFYPDRYPPRVGDLILSLPVGYYESAPYRLNFARQIIESGEPKPADQQEVYLRIPADGQAPTRHFFVLDSRHLLVFSERLDLAGDHLPHFEVFKRVGDTSWKDVTDATVPESLKKPVRVDFTPERSTFTVSSSDSKMASYRWSGSRIIPSSAMQ